MTMAVCGLWFVVSEKVSDTSRLVRPTISAKVISPRTPFSAECILPTWQREDFLSHAYL